MHIINLFFALPERIGNLPISRRNRGSVLLYIVVSMVIIAVLGTAMVSFFSSSTVGVSSPQCQDRARYEALSGLRYALDQVHNSSNATELWSRVAAMHQENFSLGEMDDHFHLALDNQTISQYLVINATGYACSNRADFLVHAGNSSSPGIDLKVNPIPIPAFGQDSPAHITFEEDMQDFEDQGEGGDSSDSVSVDTLNKTVTLGNNQYNSFGCVWYQGDKRRCQNGLCPLDDGVRLYFEVDAQAGSQGDGFTFAIISGENNSADACGGDPNMGELLAYAGDGLSGDGIQPPKLGLEFDIYPNQGSGSECSVGNRRDANNMEHSAHIYWGDYTVPGGWPCSATYDDNRHGDGGGGADEPQNTDNSGGTGDGADGYYYRGAQDWISSGDKIRVRLEITRQRQKNAAGNYEYQLKAWLKKQGDSYPAGLDNVNADYPAPPEMMDSIELSPAMHCMLNTFRFGWTHSTGGATQSITLSDFKLNFKPNAYPNFPDDFVSRWMFNENSGQDIYDQNNLNNGTMERLYGYDDYPQWVWAKECSGLDFEGTHAYVHIDDHPSLDLTTQGTIAAWIYVDSVGSAFDFGGLVHKGDRRNWRDEAYSLQFWYNRIRFALFQQNPYVNDHIQSNTVISDDQWYHVAATWDTQNAQEMKIYIDGQLDNQKNSNFVPDVTNGGLNIGAQLEQRYNRLWHNCPFDGIIDDVVIYDYSLNATQIQAYYNATK